MAFPTTSVLTNFTGADEDPLSEGGNWAGPVRNGGRQCERNTNQAAHSLNPDNAASATSYWSASTFGPDVEVFATIAQIPNSTHGVAVWGRIQNPNNATTMQAYLGVYTDGTGWRLFKVLGGSSFTQIGSTVSNPAPTNGEKIGLEIAGSSLTLYHYTGGAWVNRVTGSDSSITGTGNIGMEFATASDEVRLDDFGGGTIVIPGGVAPTLLTVRSTQRW